MCLIDFTSGIVIYDRLVKLILDCFVSVYLSTCNPRATIDTNPPTQMVRLSGLRYCSTIPRTHTRPSSSPNHAYPLPARTTTNKPIHNPSTTTAKSKSPTSPTPATPILLGPSLESDLKVHVLKPCHTRCIDTALLYHHSRERPLKLGLA